jgi:hypothetical protein
MVRLRRQNMNRFRKSVHLLRMILLRRGNHQIMSPTSMKGHQIGHREDKNN